MNDVHAHALFEKTCGRFEAEQAAADDGGMPAGLRSQDNGLHVVQVAEGEHAGEIVAGHGDDHRQRSRRDHQLVVGRDLAVLRTDGFGAAVDLRDPVTLVERDAALDVPAVAMNDDLFECLFSGKDGRKHDPVVIDARLGIENRDVEGVRRHLEKMLQHPAGCHAVANDDELLPALRLDRFAHHQAASASVMAGGVPSHDCVLGSPSL